MGGEFHEEVFRGFHRHPVVGRRCSDHRSRVGAGRRLEVVLIGMATSIEAPGRAEARTPGYKWV
jgi:hypothetical protein